MLEGGNSTVDGKKEEREAGTERGDGDGEGIDIW